MIKDQCLLKKIQKIISIFIVFILCVASFNTVTVKAVEDDELKEIIRYLNKARRTLEDHRERLEISEALTNAALNHSEYLNRNSNSAKDLTHQQKKGLKGFTGIYPRDRASYYKYENPYVAEIYLDSDKSIFDGIIQLLNNPYNRVHLLNPNYTDIGIAKTGDKLVILLGGAKSNKKEEVVYPLKNQEKISTDWTPIEEAGERDPYWLKQGAEPPYGYPISYTVYSSLKVKRFTIDNSSGIINKSNNDENIRRIIMTPAKDEELSRTVLILPLEPLASDTEYEVNIKGTITFANNTKKYIDEKWRFTTGNISNRNDIDVQKEINRQLFAELIFGEFSKMKYTYRNVLESSNITFTDVAREKSNSYAEPIYTLRQRKIMMGYGDDTFKPLKNITREEAIVIAMRTYEFLSGEDVLEMELEEPHAFKDMEQCSSWAKKSAEVAFNLGIIKGNGLDELKPKDNITFEESKIIVNRINALLDDEDPNEYRSYSR